MKNPHVLMVSIFADSNYPGMPKWEYSLPYAFLQAYLTKSENYNEIAIEHFSTYEIIERDLLIRELVSRKYNILAFSCYTWNIKLILSVVEEIKLQRKDILIVMGGPEFDPSAGRIMEEHPAIDFIVIGEGEVTFKELVEHLIKPEESAPGDIPGLIYRNEENVPVTNKLRTPIQNLDDIPSPYLLGLIDLKDITNSQIGIESMRGCPFNCGYCNYQKGNKKVRYFSLERVEAELQLVLKHKPKQLYLMDPTFNLSGKRSKQILRTIVDTKQNDIFVNAEMMPEFLDEETLDLAGRAGMKVLELGVQSFNPVALKFMGRKRDEAKLFQNTDHAIKYIDTVWPQIIIGLPGDTVPTFLESFDKIYVLPTKQISVFILQLIPGTRFRMEEKIHGFVYQKEAPNFIIKNNYMDEKDIELLSGFRIIVLLTASIKLILNKVIEKNNLRPHELFLPFAEKNLAALSDLKWPVSNEVDYTKSEDILDAFLEYLVGNEYLHEGQEEEIDEEFTTIKCMLYAHIYSINTIMAKKPVIDSKNKPHNLDCSQMAK